MSLAVVIPVFNEEKGLLAHVREIDRIFRADGIDAKYMLVDDGSRDATWQVVKALHEELPAVSGIRFPAISARRPPSAPASPPPRATSTSSWTPTCSIRRAA